MNVDLKYDCGKGSLYFEVNKCYYHTEFCLVFACLDQPATEWIKCVMNAALTLSSSSCCPWGGHSLLGFMLIMGITCHQCSFPRTQGRRRSYQVRCSFSPLQLRRKAWRFHSRAVKCGAAPISGPRLPSWSWTRRILSERHTERERENGAWAHLKQSISGSSVFGEKHHERHWEPRATVAFM